MKNMKIVSILLLAVLLTGCTNLKAVRDFAGESAKLSAYTDLTTRFRDTYERERPYLFGQAEELAQQNDKKRKAAYDNLLNVHAKTAQYMMTLAKLAGDKTFDLSKGMDSLAAGVKAYPDSGFDAKQVDAVANIAKVASKWATSYYQEQAVKEMVREGNADLQITLEGMKSLVRYYRKTSEGEKKNVLGLFEVELPYADSPKDRLLSALARAHEQSKAAEYESINSKFDAAEKGIASIAKGHQQLFESVDKLSSDEAKAAISGYAKDIKIIRDNLKIARD